MQVLSSLKTAKTRHRDCQIVRRKGRVYVICKSNSLQGTPTLNKPPIYSKAV